MRRPAVVTLTCALAIGALATGGAQTPQQRPVFKSGAVFVNVDAYPRRDGKVVEGLTKADFEVFEDGKPQAVEEFEFVRVAPNTPDDERRDPTSVEDANRQAADPHNRVFVVYLDVFSVTLFGSHYARQPIIEFLSRTIGPNDLFGVMTPELPASAITFARRTETLDTELRKYWDWGESDRLTIFPRNDAERRLMLCQPDGEALVAAFRKDETFRSLEQMVGRLGSLRDERKNILFVSEGWGIPQQAPTMGSSRSRYPSRPGVGVGPGGKLGIGASMSGDTDRAWCDMQFAALAGIDYQFRFRELVSQASRANVSFYPIDVGGLRTYQVPASVAPPRGMKSEDIPAWAEQYRVGMVGRTEMLQDLAAGTDGKAIVNTNDLTGAVRKISDDLSAYYLLGYYSSNSAADGKFRRIDVKVKQPGVKVSARKGYLGPTAAMKKAEEEAASKPAYVATAIDAEMTRLSRLRTDAKIYSAATATSAGLDVVVEIAGAEFGSGRWTSGATVTITVAPKDDGPKPVSVESKLEPGSRGVLVKVPLTGTNTGGWRVRSRIEAGGEVLDDEIEVEAPAPSVIGEPAVFRGGAGPRSPLRPVADFKFYRTERVHVEWTLTKPLDDRTARLLSRRGDALAIPVTLTERTDGDRLVLAADLVLAPLADADYCIEVTATAGGEKIQKLLAFRVVR